MCRLLCAWLVLCLVSSGCSGLKADHTEDIDPVVITDDNSTDDSTVDNTIDEPTVADLPVEDPSVEEQPLADLPPENTPSADIEPNVISQVEQPVELPLPPPEVPVEPEVPPPPQPEVAQVAQVTGRFATLTKACALHETPAGAALREVASGRRVWTEPESGEWVKVFSHGQSLFLESECFKAPAAVVKEETPEAPVTQDPQPQEVAKVEQPPPQVQPQPEPIPMPTPAPDVATTESANNVVATPATVHQDPPPPPPVIDPPAPTDSSGTEKAVVAGLIAGLFLLAGFIVGRRRGRSAVSDMVTRTWTQTQVP